jgi:transposase InsO family protein
MTVDEARAKLIEDYESECYSVSELAMKHGVSRQWTHELLRRHREDPQTACQTRSRRPHHSPQATDEKALAAMVAFQKKHPTLSPRKIIERLTQLHPELDLPASSTAYEIFRRMGIVAPARRAKNERQPHPGRPEIVANEPGDVTTADFKGQFKTLDGIYTYPLTILDSASRYLYAIDAYASTAYEGVLRSFQRVFREHGQPKVVLTDNGTPFASCGLGRLSRFHIWLMKHSVRPFTIEPGQPQQNGKHERMHRTLKKATALPPQKNQRCQQKRFDTFRVEYNIDRTHDSLGKKTPASVYRPSRRPYVERVTPYEYKKHFEVRRVSSQGSIKWLGDAYFLSEVLAGECVGLEEREEQTWIVWFREYEIARFDEQKGIFVI